MSKNEINGTTFGIEALRITVNQWRQYLYYSCVSLQDYFSICVEFHKDIESTFGISNGDIYVIVDSNGYLFALY